MDGLIDLRLHLTRIFLEACHGHPEGIAKRVFVVAQAARYIDGIAGRAAGSKDGQAMDLTRQGLAQRKRGSSPRFRTVGVLYGHQQQVVEAGWHQGIIATLGERTARMQRRWQMALELDPKSLSGGHLTAQVRFEHFEELGKPRGSVGPRGAGDEFAVGEGFGHLDGDVGASGEFDLGGAGGIGADPLAGDDVGGGEQLRAVAERGDWFVRLVEVADDGEHFGVEAEVFGGASAGDDECVVVRGVDVGEGGVEGEVVAGFLGVSLVALEVVNRGTDELAGLLSGQTAWTGGRPSAGPERGP